MRMIPTSLRGRVVILLLLAALPVTTYNIYAAYLRYGLDLEDGLTRVDQLTLAESGYFRQIVEGSRFLLTGIAGLPSVQAATQVATGAAPGDAEALAACGEAVYAAWAAFAQFSNMRVLSADGEVRCSSLKETEPRSEAHRPWFLRVRDELKFTVGDYQESPITNQPVSVAAMPIKARDGAMIGAVAAEISLDWLDRAAAGVERVEGSHSLLLTSDGEPITSLPPDDQDAYRAFPPSDALKQLIRTKVGDQAVWAEARGGGTYAYGVARMAAGVTLVLAVPRKQVERAALDNLVDRLIQVVAVLLLTLLAAWFVIDQLITRPVLALAQASRRLSRGDLTARPAVPKAESELRQLALTFIHMTEQIASREENLRDAVAERETLLREVHHRVKNNLQIITSLLNMQMGLDQPAVVRQKLSEARTRIRALSLVHDQLYGGESLAKADLSRLLSELCRQIWQIYDADNRQVAYAVEVAPTPVPMDTAIPLSMIVTEALTNALKYAFPDGRAGTVRVRAAAMGESWTLIVEDDGVGFAGADGQREGGLGRRLIAALARQLGAEYSLTGEQGTRLTISLPRAALTGKETDGPAEGSETPAEDDA